MRTRLEISKINTFFAIACSLLFAASNASAEDAGLERANTYFDDSRDDYLSGWKAMLTNVMPDRILETGIWFDPAPVPRPFATAEQVTPFSDMMRARLRDNSTDGLLVIKDGAIVQQYFRFGFDIDDIHLIHSTGKAFTSFAISPVYDAIGDEGLDRPLSVYLPKLGGKFFGEATLRQSLDMQNGMEWTEDYRDPTTATMLSGPVGGWDPLDPARGAESWYEAMFDFEPYGAHGETWVYNNSSVIAASFAAAAIAGDSFADLVQSSYDRLGFEDASWMVSNAFNELSAEGGQALSIRDHAKLGRYMLEAEGSQYVEDVWNAGADPQDPADAKFLEKYGGLGMDGYKNYWYRSGSGVVVALGSSGQFLYVDRNRNLVVSKMSSFVQGQGIPEFVEALSIIREIAEMH